MTAKKRLKVFIDPSLYNVLLAQKERTGRSISSLVAEAVERHLYHSELKNEIRRAGEIMKSVEEELSFLRDALRALNYTLEDLSGWIRTAAFWAALSVELQKARIFGARSLSDEEFARFKKAWRTAHEFADERIFNLTGERVWKGYFDPERPPKKDEP